jgi:hypothetical protein
MNASLTHVSLALVEGSSRAGECVPSRVFMPGDSDRVISKLIWMCNDHGESQSRLFYGKQSVPDSHVANNDLEPVAKRFKTKLLILVGKIIIFPLAISLDCPKNPESGR